MGMNARLVKLEDERARRRRLQVAETVAALEGISAEVAFARTVVDPADKAALLERFGREHLVDVGAVTRWLAQRHGLTAAETAQAIATAERVAALLEDHHGAA